jgi:hypothetical protein
MAIAPLYPGLRRFKQGRNFKQWTGDDSKALMKVHSILCLQYLKYLSLTGIPLGH